MNELSGASRYPRTLLSLLIFCADISISKDALTGLRDQNEKEILKTTFPLQFVIIRFALNRKRLYKIRKQLLQRRACVHLNHPCVLRRPIGGAEYHLDFPIAIRHCPPNAYLGRVPAGCIRIITHRTRTSRLSDSSKREQQRASGARATVGEALCIPLSPYGQV